MSNEEIMERLEFATRYIEGKAGKNFLLGDYDVKAIRAAISLLRTHPDANPSEPQGDGWISVEDKDNPPPEAKKVIVWLKLRGGDICDMAYYTGEDGWYYEGWDAPHHGVVTH